MCTSVECSSRAHQTKGKGMSRQAFLPKGLLGSEGTGGQVGAVHTGEQKHWKNIGHGVFTMTYQFRVFIWECLRKHVGTPRCFVSLYIDSWKSKWHSVVVNRLLEQVSVPIGFTFSANVGRYSDLYVKGNAKDVFFLLLSFYFFLACISSSLTVTAR